MKVEVIGETENYVDTAEVARRLGVKTRTVRKWRERSTTRWTEQARRFPTPIMLAGRSPLWWWPEVAAWAQRTGREKS